MREIHLRLVQVLILFPIIIEVIINLEVEKFNGIVLTKETFLNATRQNGLKMLSFQIKKQQDQDAPSKMPTFETLFDIIGNDLRYIHESYSLHMGKMSCDLYYI